MSSGFFWLDSALEEHKLYGHFYRATLSVSSNCSISSPFRSKGSNRWPWILYLLTLVSLNSDHIFVSSIFVIASQLPSLSVLSGLHWDIDQHKYEGDKNNAGGGKSSTKGTEAKLEAVTRTISRECIESIEEFKSHR